MTNLVINVPGEYISLGLVLQSALEQASKGKGKERHASEGEAYENQIICEVARRVGLGYPLGQAVKKIYESQRIGGERGVAELLGALNYVAAAVIVMREGMETAPKADEEPKFKPGDRVQYRVTLPSVSDSLWRDATYVEHRGAVPHPHTIRSDMGIIFVKDEDIRPAPKAEGVEELVVSPFDEERMRQSMPGIVPQDGASDFDAPQTPEKLYQHIVDCNPATCGHPHKPTGEELAEMAEEDA